MSNGRSYDPHAVEEQVYRFWEQGGYFHAEPSPDKRPYVIDIPLPNVTGALHLGHAINNTLQDVLIRRHRMCGREALWMPGTDHAGIATQAVVERRLKEEQNLTRHELGREGLVKKIWEWKDKYGGLILQQLRRMGFSCDWERARFTLDEVCAKAVYEVFFEWFKAGLIYRGLRLVNWDAFLQTAVADDEIVHETLQGHMWHYRYPILEGTGSGEQGTGVGVGRCLGEDVVRAAVERATRADARMGVDYVSIATTRPETMLGDTAIAVHPGDERYKHLIGKQCILPLVNRPIPIIADGVLVNREFGTGCVKVTPGHDPNDYACAQRNGLEMINILTVDGQIRAEEMFQPYGGMDRYAARDKVVADLEALGLMEKIEDYEHEVGHSDRSKTPIEPMLSEQWFVRMADLAESAMEAVRDGRVRFYPARYAKTYLDWLGEKRDWCISRQLWWGHRIPVWRRRFELTEDNWSGEFLGVGMDSLLEGNWGGPDDLVVRVVRTRDGAVVSDPAREFMPVCADAEGEYEFIVCLRNPGDRGTAGLLEQAGFERDPDVLDTWFSSALWPFSTLGWPDNYGAGIPSRDRQGAVKPSDERSLASARGSDQHSLPPTDLSYFYPTSVLVTGREIITLWVARMVMTGLYFMKRVPFQHVYIHPNIQDGQGRRMSKSLGNGVDPLDIIDLHGADALRFTMVQMASETQDARMPVKRAKLPDGREVNTSDRFEPARNLCNKLWQAATGFVLPNLEPDGTPRALKPEELAIEDRWIVSRLAATIAEVDRRYDRYQLNEMVGLLRSFFWDDYCDWYIELVKPRLFERDAAGQMVSRTDRSAAAARQVLAWVLDQTLRLLHPVMPYITEELWRLLGQKAPQRGLGNVQPAGAALIVASWPDAEALARDIEVEREMQALQDVIRALRDTLARINTARSATKEPAIGKLPQAVIRTDERLAGGLQEQMQVLLRLGRCEALEIGVDVAKPPESATQVLVGVEVYVPLGGLMDLDAERKRLEKERKGLHGHIERLVAKLANEGFVSKAPAAVVEQERSRLTELKDRLATLDRNLADISA